MYAEADMFAFRYNPTLCMYCTSFLAAGCMLQNVIESSVFDVQVAMHRDIFL